MFTTLLPSMCPQTHSLAINVQWGFQSGKSTITALLATTNLTVFKCWTLERRCVLFYLTSRKYLIQFLTMHSCRNYRTQVLTTTLYAGSACSFLTDREQKVLVNDATSNCENRPSKQGLVSLLSTKEGWRITGKSV